MRLVGRLLTIVFGALAAALVLWVSIGETNRTLLHAKLMDPTPPAAPDYADPAAWAALPERADKADATLVPGTLDQQANAEADVFFLYAGSNWTLFWNAPPDHWLVRSLVDGALLEQWASAFNGCCRVYAPRYRQEAIEWPKSEEALHEHSLDVAYADIRAAFEHYLATRNTGRPIVIAGAQSGARHAVHLLIDEFAGKPLRAQLVAAYVPGAHIDAEARQQLGDIAVCAAPTDTACVSVWNATGRQAFAKLEPVDEACVNPLSWRADESLAPRELNLGTVGGRLWGNGPLAFDVGLVDAQCLHGRLWVTPPQGRWFWQPDGPGDFHIQNYTFYFANIRENASARVGAFLAQRPLRKGRASEGTPDT